MLLKRKPWGAFLGRQIWVGEVCVVQKCPSMPQGLLNYCIQGKKKKHCCVWAGSVSPWLLVCDSDEADKDRKWRSEGGEQSQTGRSRLTDIELRVSEEAYFGSNFPENSLESFIRGVENLPSAAILGKKQSFRGLSSAATVWLLDFFTCTRQVRTLSW